MKRSGLLLAFALALVAGSVTAHAECKTIGGSADMVTTDLAKFMAEAALKNAIASHGMKPAGPVTMTCKEDTFTANCKAFRKACS